MSFEHQDMSPTQRAQLARQTGEMAHQFPGSTSEVADYSHLLTARVETRKPHEIGDNHKMALAASAINVRFETSEEKIPVGVR
jgi:hypothetical protein